MSNSLQILCIKDTEGYWTEGEMYPSLPEMTGFFKPNAGDWKLTSKLGWRDGGTSVSGCFLRKMAHQEPRWLCSGKVEVI
ncbi:TPA: hypothetical protein ACUIZA_004300 [Klebsiella pneumoniae]